MRCLPQHHISRRIVLCSLLCVLGLVLAACDTSPDQAPTPTLSAVEQEGAAVFAAHCARCHSVGTDSIIVGPSMKGIAVSAGSRVAGMEAQTYLEESIMNPDAYVVEGFMDNLMPENFGDVLADDEIDALVAYLLTLNH